MEAWDHVSELASTLCDESSVEFAVAFGSVVTGPWTPSSDIDIAVKFDGTLSSSERFRQLCSLSGNVQRSGAPFVDVSDLETLPLPVARRAVHGEFLCGDESAFNQYQTTINGEYEDRRDELRRHQQDVIDRIAHSGLRG